MDHYDDDFVPRRELEAVLRAFKAEVKTALTRQTILILASVAFLKSNVQLPTEITVGALGLFGLKLFAGLFSR